MNMYKMKKEKGKLRGWLVVNAFLNMEKFHEIYQWLLKAGKSYGIELELKTNAQLMPVLGQYKKMDGVDFVIFWDKDVVLAKALEQRGLRLYNSALSIEICDDKRKTHLYLEQHGIPMPDTMPVPMTYEGIGYADFSFVEKAEKQFGYPFVVKEAFGSFGQQVYLVKDREQLKDILEQTAARPVLFQQYIRESHGKDVRLQVVGNRVVASMYRFAKEDDFRANISNGGSMKSYEPSEEICSLALRTCKVLGLDFAGVDLLFGPENQMMVCEVNSNAHFKNIYDCTGINTADAIIKHIMETIYD